MRMAHAVGNQDVIDRLAKLVDIEPATGRARPEEQGRQDRLPGGRAGVHPNPAERQERCCGGRVADVRDVRDRPAVGPDEAL